MDKPDTSDAKSVRWCLAAATEKLLERRYGIGKLRATEPNGAEWPVWYSILGNPNKPLIEQRNVARTLLACGVAGFSSIRLAPGLVELYYLLLCALFAFSGLWTAVWFFIQARSPIRADVLRLKSVLLEHEGCSPPVPGTDIAHNK
jgi:hypothetical protein